MNEVEHLAAKETDIPLRKLYRLKTEIQVVERVDTGFTPIKWPKTQLQLNSTVEFTSKC